MGVTAQEYESIRAHRQTYLHSGHGKAVLCQLLAGLGTFQDPDELYLVARDRPQLMMGVIEGLKVLKNLGVWTADNIPRLVDAMAGLPMPEIEAKGEYRGATQ